jgi:predicted nucleotidyltransferase
MYSFSVRLRRIQLCGSAVRGDWPPDSDIAWMFHILPIVQKQDTVSRDRTGRDALPK